MCGRFTMYADDAELTTLFDIDLVEGEHAPSYNQAPSELIRAVLEALIVPGPGRICGILGYDAEYIIPFECIRRFGEDIILVEIKEEKFLQKY